MQRQRDAVEIGVGGRRVSLPWPTLQVVATDGVTIALLDPDAYLQDPEYKAARRAGAPAIKNLWAFSPTGEKLWESQLPEASDYYYKVVSLVPLAVLSFSSWRCVISLTTGEIREKEFFK